MHPCQTCDFWDGKCEYENLMSCKLPCLPGTTCHFNPIQPVQPKDYDIKDQSMIAKERKKRAALRKEQAMKLWESGCSDKEIARACCVSVSSIRGWRKKKGLLGNKKLKFDESIALSMYHLGYSDYKIANACNVSNTCIQLWRKRKHLNSNYRSTKKKNAASKAQGFESGTQK